MAYIQIWLAHPGGPKILGSVQEILQLKEHDFRFSWAALKEVGNVSSVSVLRAYELCMQECTCIFFFFSQFTSFDGWKL